MYPHMYTHVPSGYLCIHVYPLCKTTQHYNTAPHVPSYVYSVQCHVCDMTHSYVRHDSYVSCLCARQHSTTTRCSCSAVLCNTTQHCARQQAQCKTTQHCATQHSTVQDNTALCKTTQHYNKSCCARQHSCCVVLLCKTTQHPLWCCVVVVVLCCLAQRVHVWTQVPLYTGTPLWCCVVVLCCLAQQDLL